MVDQIEEPWEVESIPDDGALYMRIFAGHFDGTRILAIAFQDHEGISVDWAKYSTPEQTRAGSPRKSADQYGVVQLIAGEVRGIHSLEVIHAPVPGNRAHSNIIGAKDTEVRKKLRDLAERRTLILPG
jgi:hypothetical protein